MTWAALIQMLLTFFGPLIQKWLEGLLTPPAAGTPASYAPAEGVSTLFKEARAKTWWFQFARRAALSSCERVATARAHEFYAALRGGPVPTMSEAERATLAV